MGNAPSLGKQRYMGLTDLPAMMNSVSETEPRQSSGLHKNAHVHTPHICIKMYIYTKLYKASQPASLPACLPVLSGLGALHPTHLLPFSYLFGSRNNWNLCLMG